MRDDEVSVEWCDWWQLTSVLWVWASVCDVSWDKKLSMSDTIDVVEMKKIIFAIKIVVKKYFFKLFSSTTLVLRKKFRHRSVKNNFFAMSCENFRDDVMKSVSLMKKKLCLRTFFTEKNIFELKKNIFAWKKIFFAWKKYFSLEKKYFYLKNNFSWQLFKIFYNFLKKFLLKNFFSHHFAKKFHVTKRKNIFSWRKK